MIGSLESMKMNENIQKDVIIVIPTYNEAGNIEKLIHKIYALPWLPSVLIIDDNSSDGTAGIVEGLQSRYPQAAFDQSGKKIRVGERL